jgi:hypothetical protein
MVQRSKTVFLRGSLRGSLQASPLKSHLKVGDNYVGKETP